MDVLGELGDNVVMTHKTVPCQETGVIEPPRNTDDLLKLANFLESDPGETTLCGPDGEQIRLLLPAFEVLRKAVQQMMRGVAVSVEPIDRKMTTQEAANLLGVSRNTVVRLLDEHELRFERLGSSRHRRLLLSDVLAYRQRKRIEAQRRLDELTRQAAEDGLYDASMEDYEEALRDARKP